MSLPIPVRFGLFFLFLIYPFLLLADVMSLAGQPSPSSNAAATTQKIAARTFMYSSLAYPLVYIPCVVAWNMLKNANREDAARKVSAIPLFYLIILLVELAVWANSRSPPSSRRPVPNPSPFTQPDTLPTSQPY